MTSSIDLDYLTLSLKASITLIYLRLHNNNNKIRS